MILRELTLKNFRVFSEITIQFKDGINIITGMNGQGKSSILESIYYLALTRSFRTNSDKSVIQYSSKSFDARGKFFSSKGKTITVRIYFSESEGKNVFLRDKRISSYSEFIGLIPCVVLSLSDTKLVYGGPSERRKFMDILLSQTSPLYLEDLKKYKRTLFQRNTLLLSGNIKMIKDQLPSWNKQLIDSGSAIIMRRLSFVSFLNEHLSSYYYKLANINSDIKSMYYSSSGSLQEDCSNEHIKLAFDASLARLSGREIEKRTTLAGPHRDDILLFHNHKVFKEYSSQGETKTLIIALKLLEWEYVRNHRQINPILLLDDIFGELDTERMKGLLHFVRSVGQSFITTTLTNKFELSDTDTIFSVNDQKVYHA